MFTGFASHSNALTGKHQIFLHKSNADYQLIGTVDFRPTGTAQSTYTINFDDAQFEDHFLSMRPFKCLAHTHHLACHLPYPYHNRRTISADDLTDLEYDLLFIRKSSSEYGINPYHGMYYRLELREDALVGTLFETDLDILAAPPEDGNLRPITEEALYEAEADRYAYPDILITHKNLDSPKVQP